jgi:hypothetical protein
MASLIRARLTETRRQAMLRAQKLAFIKAE